MSFQFIVGRLHTNRKEYIYNQLVNWIQEDASGQVFYLVPDHIKFESEMNILDFIKQSPSRKKQQYAGMIDLQVFSFSRLAWYYLQDTALYSHSQLTETGLSMLVRRILREKEDQLTIYRGESRQQGFVEKLTALFMEMRNGRVEPEDLSILKNQTQNEEANPFDLDAKLHDLNLIYDEFIFQLQGKYIEREDVLEALIKEVKERDMSQTRIIIDNFHSFSAQEQALILAFAEHAQEVKVSLVLDKKYATEPPELNNLFYEPGMTYYRLYQQLLDRAVPILHDKIINEKNEEHCQEINELESYWVNSFELSPQYSLNSDVSMDGCIEVREAETKQAEVLFVATNIKRMVASGKYRYKDILVTSRILEDYRTIMESTFDENDIELFVDDADTMAGHAIVEFIQSLLDI
ncbi:PD-(D/E)XK nuclease family protein, partial [Alkalibacterium iburiense]